MTDKNIFANNLHKKLTSGDMSDIEKYFNEKFAGFEIKFAELPAPLIKHLENTYAFYYWRLNERFSELKQTILKTFHLN
jgi:hypothetical protein